MTSMTTEERIASCFQRIQALETTRSKMIRWKTEETQFLLDFPNAHGARVRLAANTIQVADEELILIYNQQQALRRLAEHLSGLLSAFPRPMEGASG